MQSLGINLMEAYGYRFLITEATELASRLEIIKNNFFTCSLLIQIRRLFRV